jgi:hypothetical protein
MAVPPEILNAGGWTALVSFQAWIIRMLWKEKKRVKNSNGNGEIGKAKMCIIHDENLKALTKVSEKLEKGQTKNSEDIIKLHMVSKEIKSNQGRLEKNMDSNFKEIKTMIKNGHGKK